MTVCMVVVAWLVGTAVVRVTVVFEHWLFLQAVTVWVRVVTTGAGWMAE